MARCYAGTVMIEGATVSEGRGTTRPLEVLFGAPDIDAEGVWKLMRQMAPEWCGGVLVRDCWFEPTFHKHAGKLCNGLMMHAEGPDYAHELFRPWRLQALAINAIRTHYPDYELWMIAGQRLAILIKQRRRMKLCVRKRCASICSIDYLSSSSAGITR